MDSDVSHIASRPPAPFPSLQGARVSEGARAVIDRTADSGIREKDRLLRRSFQRLLVGDIRRMLYVMVNQSFLTTAMVATKNGKPCSLGAFPLLTLEQS